MGRVPITVMGFRCERCAHEWIPRGIRTKTNPLICPKCKSPYWNRARKTMMTYEDFQKKVRNILRNAKEPLTWTEIRTGARLPQLFPNNQWVRKMEKDIGLERSRDAHGIIHWTVK
jgi:hypothetical protein